MGFIVVSDVDKMCWMVESHSLINGIARVWAAWGGPWVWRPRSP